MKQSGTTATRILSTLATLENVSEVMVGLGTKSHQGIQHTDRRVTVNLTETDNALAMSKCSLSSSYISPVNNRIH